MKKSLLAAVLVTVVSMFAFAEKLTVSFVEGKVTVLTGDDWISVSEGMILDSEDTINTGLNASVAFDNGESIKPMRKGKICDFVKGAGSSGNLVLGSKLTKESMKTLVAVGKSADGAGRASEAKEDLDWDE